MLRIIDPHIHLWDLWTRLYPGLETPAQTFHGSTAAIARSYLLPEYLAEADARIEIAGAVHVEAFPTDAAAEVEHLQGVADAAPIPIVIVGNADLTAPDCGAALDRMREHAGFRGVRQVLNLHPDPLYSYVTRDILADPAFHGGFGELGPRGLSFDLQLYPQQMTAAAALAQAHPETQIVLNHAGMWCDRTLAGWREWKAGLRALAACPNVAVKISGLGMLDPAPTVESLRPLVFEVLDAFGTDRAMFASNFPVDKLFSTFVWLWSAFDTITQGLAPDERSALFHDTARRIYRL